MICGLLCLSPVSTSKGTKKSHTIKTNRKYSRYIGLIIVLNWELVLDENKKPRLANRNWVVQEKVYVDDEKLYRYVQNYMKTMFTK